MAFFRSFQMVEGPKSHHTTDNAVGSIKQITAPVPPSGKNL